MIHEKLKKGYNFRFLEVLGYMRLTKPFQVQFASEGNL